MISLVGIAKHYGARTLFQDLNLTISIADRIGLVGPNGSGKTTLLDLLAGRLEPDAGHVARNRRATVGYLPQEVPKFTGRRLLEEAVAGHEALDHLRQRLALIEEEMRAATDERELEALAARQGEAERRFEEGGGYDLPARARRVLAGLGFTPEEFDRPTETFSGGWLMRLGLGKLLLTEPDLLLLDEPTNYLDLDSVLWLEDHLRGYDGSLVLVSHDRALLDAVPTRIASLEGGGLVAYAGNFSASLRQRALREEGLEAQRKAQEREIAQQTAFIERFRYKASKARQVQSRVKRLEKLERVGPGTRRRTVRIAFPEPPPSSRVQLELKGMAKDYDGTPVYRGVDLAIERGERIVLVGPNGAGKTTLLKIIAGTLPPSGGERIVGAGVTIGYHAQHQVEALDYERTVLDEVCAAAPRLPPERVRGLLGRFLFSGDDAFKKVGVLSGGEKARVALARILLNPPNLLLLDEPTTHLDMESIESLSEALEDFAGTLVMISHDRRFVERVATRVLEAGGLGLRSFPGTLPEFLAEKERAAAETAERAPAAPREAPAGRAGHRTREERRAEAERRNDRFRRMDPLRKEVAELEREVEALGSRIAAIEARLADPEFYAQASAFGETFREYNDLKAELEAKSERWTSRAAELEELEREA